VNQPNNEKNAQKEKRIQIKEKETRQ